MAVLRCLVTLLCKGHIWLATYQSFSLSSLLLCIAYRFTICHKTEIIKKTLNPDWKEFSIFSRALCNGDYDRQIKFECYDWDRDGG